MYNVLLKLQESKIIKVIQLLSVCISIHQAHKKI